MTCVQQVELTSRVSAELQRFLTNGFLSRVIACFSFGCFRLVQQNSRRFAILCAVTQSGIHSVYFSYTCVYQARSSDEPLHVHVPTSD